MRGQIRDIKVPQEAPQMAVDLVRECLDVDPAKRPTMEQIIHRLMVCQGEGQVPRSFHYPAGAACCALYIIS